MAPTEQPTEDNIMTGTDERKATMLTNELPHEDSDPDHHDADDEKRDKILTRRLLWRLDRRILPVLILLVLCSFLDRTNVGNAKLYNLEKDLGMTNLQYQQGLAAFYPLYIAAEVPSNLVLKRVTPRIWIAFLTFLWGLLCMCLGFVHNFAQFISLRALLGLAEGGLFPAMVLYLSGIYTRSELALRIGVLYTATSLSGAFGGLLARAMAAIGDRGGLSAWRWIFVIEGLFTFIVAGFTYISLPNDIPSASFLSEDERKVGIRRLSGIEHGTGNTERDEKFSFAEIGRAIFSPQTWLTAAAYFGLLSGIYSFGLFLPTIIKGLGYTANEAQLWSVIPYAVAACTTLAVAFLSDRLKIRGIMMLCTMPVAILGYGLIANIGADHPRVKYGMTFLMATGIYSSVPCVLAWLSNNSAGHYKRATAAALQLAVANCGGILSVFLYPDVEGPVFYKGHTIILGLLVGGWFSILCNVLYCAKINRDKARGGYDKYRGYGDDREPAFRMVM
ncbi:major facilitator superfamily domain-containing protein [Apodospora peruviana]|uniref:Major facilitator superfamily domain-containing protein n=1 Tax=Apodospora peruviana TaxID=516989 RepID=A0AAE0LYG8_9PEZI|nr:major facilitator superfamily domain-containing protein [Apodospora peruviana]